MTETPKRPRRWVMWAGLVLLVLAAFAAFGTRATSTSTCLVCRTRIATVQWGLTFGEFGTLPLWRTLRETPCPEVLRFLGEAHEHGSAIVHTDDEGPNGLFVRTIPTVHWSRDAGVGRWIENYPAMADSLERRIQAGCLKADDLRAALTMELYVSDPNRADLTAEQQDLLQRMATIIGEELQLDPRRVSFRAETSPWLVVGPW